MSYRLLSYRSGGATRAGIAVAGRIYDAARLAGEPGYATVLGVLADWKRARRSLARAARHRDRPVASERPAARPCAARRAGALSRGDLLCRRELFRSPARDEPCDERAGAAGSAH